VAERVARYSRLYGAAGRSEGRAATACALASVPEAVGRRLLSYVFDYDAYRAKV
jgi:hypothetical protein